MAIHKGSTVKMHYTLTVEGEVVDTSDGNEPLAFEHGGGEIIPGLEKALEGLKVGDTKSVTVASAEAYGERNEQAVQKVPKEAFQETDNLQVGMVVQGEAQGQQFQATVTAMDDKEVTLDYNHPLAGKTLEFAVEIVDVS